MEQSENKEKLNFSGGKKQGQILASNFLQRKPCNFFSSSFPHLFFLDPTIWEVHVLWTLLQSSFTQSNWHNFMVLNFFRIPDALIKSKTSAATSKRPSIRPFKTPWTNWKRWHSIVAIGSRKLKMMFRKGEFELSLISWCWFIQKECDQIGALVDEAIDNDNADRRSNLRAR